MNNICPICNSNQCKIKGSSKTNSISVNFIDKKYKVVQCTNCHSYFVSPQIDFNDEQWSKLYGSEYFANQSKWLIRQRAKELNKRFIKAEYFLSKKTGIKFLDIGAGEGKTLIEGENRGWEVTGIDIVDNRIAMAKTDKIKFIKRKFLECEFTENHFDFRYVDSVLEHILNPIEYLLRIRRILKPGGIVYIGIPNEDSLFNDIRQIMFNLVGKKEISAKIKPFDSPYHVIGFYLNSLTFLIKKLDLEIKYIRNFGRKFDFLSFTPNKKGFWISLFFLFPIEIIGNLIKRDVYIEAYLAK